MSYELEALIKMLNADKEFLEIIKEKKLTVEEAAKHIIKMSDEEDNISEEVVLARYKDASFEATIDPQCRNKTRVLINHDQVVYAIDNGKGINKSSVDHSILHYGLTISRHHELVKKIYDFCVNAQTGSDVWCLIGGGMQLQVFFGNKDGYIATLYLDMEDEKDDVDDEYLAACGNAQFSLSVQWGARNNKYFEKDCNIEGVEVVLSDNI